MVGCEWSHATASHRVRRCSNCFYFCHVSKPEKPTLPLFTHGHMVTLEGAKERTGAAGDWLKAPPTTCMRALPHKVVSLAVTRHY